MSKSAICCGIIATISVVPLAQAAGISRALTVEGQKYMAHRVGSRIVIIPTTTFKLERLPQVSPTDCAVLKESLNPLNPMLEWCTKDSPRYNDTMCKNVRERLTELRFGTSPIISRRPADIRQDWRLNAAPPAVLNKDAVRQEALRVWGETSLDVSFASEVTIASVSAAIPAFSSDSISSRLQEILYLDPPAGEMSVVEENVIRSEDRAITCDISEGKSTLNVSSEVTVVSESEWSPSAMVLDSIWESYNSISKSPLPKSDLVTQAAVAGSRIANSAPKNSSFSDDEISRMFSAFFQRSSDRKSLSIRKYQSRSELGQHMGSKRNSTDQLSDFGISVKLVEAQ